MVVLLQNNFHWKKCNLWVRGLHLDKSVSNETAKSNKQTVADLYTINWKTSAITIITTDESFFFWLMYLHVKDPMEIHTEDESLDIMTLCDAIMNKKKILKGLISSIKMTTDVTIVFRDFMVTLIKQMENNKMW